MPIPSHLLEALDRADATWRPVLLAGLHAMQAATPDYFDTLVDFLPTDQRLFAAFAQPMDRVRYVLVGEGPYPRAESATGVCFMDGTVKGLWSDEEGGGLSKAVNKATSLRNFMKMLLVAEGRLAPDDTGTLALSRIAAASRGVPGIVQTLGEIQQKFFDAGFLLLNATLVFRETVAPVKDAKAWMPFLQTVLAALQARQPTLVLWGKIAEQLNKLPEAQALPQIAAEHPYNLTFITNSNMHALFEPMQLLRC
ncbi:uracil-DNA glycosylase [Duganella sp. FT92W]|uniref:Uracil-DNA glycosylase n=1 Tax=Pseudoduganella rivuli TaxID=2666085 RepID=A0A7X2LVN1_9BURK|nr:uracil-DNA glycosylase [Pseudoduganella rivuli]MRV75631.1 uracil-DNA glycosylase [Pseudoduganella rivuli]